MVIHTVDPADALAMLGEEDADPAQPDDCRGDGVVAFAAEQGGELAGFLAAESHPRDVHVFDLEGCPEACRLLLARATRLAGERGVSVFCSAGRGDLLAALEGAGFSRLYRTEGDEGPSYLYHRAAPGGRPPEAANHPSNGGPRCRGH